MKKIVYLVSLLIALPFSQLFAYYSFSASPFTSSINSVTTTYSYTTECTTYYYDQLTGRVLYTKTICAPVSYSLPSYQNTSQAYYYPAYSYSPTIATYDYYNSYDYSPYIYPYGQNYYDYSDYYNPSLYSYYDPYVTNYSNYYTMYQNNCYSYYDSFGYYRSSCGY